MAGRQWVACAKRDRTYLSVPYAQRAEAKKLGAYWDTEERKWYITPQQSASLFAKWNPVPPDPSKQLLVLAQRPHRPDVRWCVKCGKPFLFRGFASCRDCKNA